MYRILLVLLLLVSSFVIAQQTPGEKTIESYNFGTLETKSGPFNAKAGGATTYHNLDPSRRLGSLNKRWGYSEIDELNDGFDSLTGIYSAYLSDGRQFLVYAADSAGVGYGGLYVTEAGSDSVSNASRFWKYWSPTAPTTFSMFDDKLYAMNGVQAGAVYNFDTRKAIRFPIQAPGEPMVTPLDAGTELDGEYRYMVRVSDGSPYNTAWYSVVTAPVRASTGRIMLSGFQMNVKDTFAYAGSSANIVVYRTTANPGRLEETDSLFFVGVKIVDSGATLRQTVFIDSIHDSLLAHDSTAYEWNEITEIRGLDSTNTYSGNLYGAPSYMTRKDSLYTLATDTTKVGGIYHGIPIGKDTIGVFYACTFLDTLNDVESDTGRSLYVSNDSLNDANAGRHWWIRLQLPKLGDSVTNTVVNLYRAHRLVVGRDTSVTVKTFYGSELDNFRGVMSRYNRTAGYDKYFIEEITNEGILGSIYVKKYAFMMRSLTGDTVLTTPYYLVDQVIPDSAYYTDSLRYDSLVMQEMFRKTPPPTRLTQSFAYNGRMFGLDGSNLAWSLVDSASRWGAFDFISVNKDDGQRITLAYPTRRSIRVFKDKSSYNVYQDGGGNWNLTEVTNGIGCIAPNSHAVSPAGHYYLSQDGVILETEGDFMERTYKTGLISANLDNFDKLPMSAKSKAVGTYWNHKYFLTVPIAGAADTTYVWDELAQGWATWSMPIGGAAVYDTESVAGYAPGNSMYFYYPNGKTLYQYGNSLTDAGAYIWSNWTSTPFLTDEYEEAVSAIGVWFDDISSGDFIRFYDIVDGRDTVLSNLALFTDLGDTVGYREEAVASLRTGAYHQLAMWSTPDASGTWSRIDKINVSYLPLGKRTRFGETTAFVGGESGEGGAGTITFGDITGVIAGYGLSGGGLSGDVTLNVDTSVIAGKQFVRDSGGTGGASWNWSDSSSYGPDSVAWAANAPSAGFALSDFDGTTIDTTSAGKLKVKDAGIGTTQIATGGVQPIDLGTGKFKIDAYYGDSTVADSHYVTKAYADGLVIGGGGGSSDSLFINDGSTQYSNINNLLKIKEGAEVNIVREDSTTYDVLRFHVDTASLRTWGLTLRVDSTQGGAARAELADDVDTLGTRIAAALTGRTTDTEFGKVTDDTTALIAVKDSVADWDNGALDSTNLALGSVLSSEIKDGEVKPIDLGTGKFKIDAFYGDSTVADSHYTTIARLNKIADDTTNWNTVYTDYNTNGWETGDIYNGTLEPIDIHNTSKWNGLWYQADTTVADSAAATIARLNKIADDTVNFKIAYDSSQHDYYRSNEVVDSATGAARAEVADSALHVDTTYVPLRALVNRHIRDTAAVMIEDSLDNYFLSAGNLDPDQLTGDATNNDLVDSAIIQGVSLAKVGSGGATAGDVPSWSGSAWVPQAPGSVSNLTVYGDFNIFGNVKQTNRRQALDIQNSYAAHALNPLPIFLPDTVQWGNDTTRAVHPSMVYIPGGWPTAKPYKYWMSLTYGDDNWEDGFIRVSNDGETWSKFKVNATDSCPDPLLTEASLPKSDGTTYPTSHLSDNDMLMGHDGKLHVYIRNTDVTPDPDKNSIWHTSSADGVTWSSPVKVIDWRTTTQNQLLSPTFWLDTNGTYKAWSIHYTDGARDYSYVTLWESDSADGTFDSVGLVLDSISGDYTISDSTLGGDRFGGLHHDGIKDSSLVWHVDVIENGADEKFALFTVQARRGLVRYYLCPGVSRDGGRSMVVRREPILADSAHDISAGVPRTEARWDWYTIYKSTGVFVDNGNGGYFDLFYGAQGGGDLNIGQTLTDSNNNSYRIGRTRLEFLNSAAMPRVQISGRANAPADSLFLTFGGFADSATGVSDVFVDSSGYGGTDKSDYVYSTFKADKDFVLDSLIFRWMHTIGGTGSALRDSVRTDSLILYGPDLSSGTNACDSVWWVKGGKDSIFLFGSGHKDSTLSGWAVSSRTRTPMPLRIHKMAPAGSIFRLVMINRFNAARSAVHVEDIEIKGRSR